MSSAAKKNLDLPGELPRGEVVLWQGKPSWPSLAVRAFHVRKIAVYFGLILAWRLLGPYERDPGAEGLLAAVGPLLLIAIGAIGLSALLAWLYGRTTTFTITNRRVFVRFGVALPMMLNLPFRIVGAAAASVHRDGTADIPLQLIGPDRVAYLHLWPYARPWRLRYPEPMLRSIPDGARVAALLASALAAAAQQTLPQGVGNAPAEASPARAPADLASAAA